MKRPKIERHYVVFIEYYPKDPVPGRVLSMDLDKYVTPNGQDE
jgi:hypothetical protein